jgi:hypothetical protein
MKDPINRSCLRLKFMLKAPTLFLGLDPKTENGHGLLFRQS